MRDTLKKDSSELMSAIAKHILGEATGLKLKGTPERIAVTKNAIDASKRLYEALNSSEPDLDNIFELVEHKRSMATDFEKKTGLRWTI